MMHICTKFERNPSRNVACRAHTRYPPKYDLWPYKRRNTGVSITKNNRRVEFTKIHLHTKFERNPSRNAAVRAHTRMWTKMTFDPIKDGTLGAASPKTIGVYIWVWCTSVQNLKEIHQEMWPDFHQNMTFDPIKDGTLGAASPKTIGV